MHPTHAVPLRARQAGQALVVGLVLLLLGCVALYTLFNTAQFGADRQRLTNAADAAAYSATLWQARVMNYHAYANRAIVATEVHVAQSIALAGWTLYVERLAANLDTVANVFPILKVITTPIKEVAEVVAEVATEVTRYDVQFRAAEGYGYKNMLHTSQVIMDAAAGNAFTTNAIVNEVTQATDRRFFGYAMTPPTLMTREYTTKDERRRFADLVLATAPKFVTEPRSADLGAPGMACAGGIRKRGATLLSDDLERWESADTQSLHGPSMSLFGGCKSKEMIELGWGGAEATDEGFEDRIVSDANGLGDNPNAKRWIGQQFPADGKTSLAQFDGYSGMSSYMDLDYGNLGENRRFPTRRTVVLAWLRGARLRTGDRLNLGAGRLRQVERLEGEKVFALAAAEVYFRRPDSASDPGKPLEFATLFNPYWQSRLAQPTTEERAKAQALTATVGGVGE